MRGDLCPKCGQPIAPGQLMMQLVQGHFKTPPYSSSAFEKWHFGCFPHKQPVTPNCCYLCHEPLRQGEQVVYLSRANKPQPGYIRPECRELVLIAHKRCLEANHGV
jgi:hypothetical protein